MVNALVQPGITADKVLQAYAGQDFRSDEEFERLRFPKRPVRNAVALLITGELRTLPTQVMQEHFRRIFQAIAESNMTWRVFGAIDICSMTKPCGQRYRTTKVEILSLFRALAAADPADVAVTGEPDCDGSCLGLSKISNFPITRRMLSCDTLATRHWSERTKFYAKAAVAFDRVLAYEVKTKTTFAWVMQLRTDLVFQGFQRWFSEICSSKTLDQGFVFVSNDQFAAVSRPLAPYLFFGAVQHVYTLNLCKGPRAVHAALVSVLGSDYIGIGQPAFALAFYGIPTIGSEFDLGHDGEHSTYLPSGGRSTTPMRNKAFVRLSMLHNQSKELSMGLQACVEDHAEEFAQNYGHYTPKCNCTTVR